MADIIVPIVLANLIRLAKYEVNLLSGVESQVSLLERDLEFMNAFLQTSAGKRDEHHLVRVLVDQIRDVALKSEDAIDTYMARIIKKRRRNSMWKLYHCIGHASGLHHDADEISRINEEIKRIYENKSTYGIDGSELAESRSNVDAMAEQELHRRRRNVEEDDVVGFANDTTTLVKLLTDQENTDLEVVSIIGMAGLGKTTLARKIYNNTLVKDRFKDCCAWVDVTYGSQTRKVLLDILNCFTTVSDSVSQGPVEELKAELGKCLKEKRYFVVLDDIWDTRVWEEVREAFPNDLNGSRILITSRENGVAPYDSPTIPYYLQFLDPDSSWELLRKKAFRGKECPSNLVKLGKQLAKSCKGLPLSTVLLGGILADKKKSYKIWSKYVGNVNAHLTVGISILTLSYTQLPQHLKPCFLYLCLFPKDYEISVKQLTELWIAEGFVQPTGDRTVYDIAEEYLEQLIDRSLVQVASRRYDGGVKTCCIHGLVRDLCIRESSQDKFLGIYSNDNISLVSKFRHLSFQYEDYQSYSNFHFDKLPSARSLLIFNNTAHHLRSDYILKPICKWNKLVRVLSIDGELIKTIPRQIGEMTFLRLLWIYRGRFEKLPSSIFKLGHLEAIHLDSKVYNQLPKGIWMMKRLRYLHVSKFTKLPDFPSSMASPFSNLQVLSGLLVQRNTALVIAKCPNIRKLRLILVYTSNEDSQLRETELKKAMESIGKLKYLESFKFEYVNKGSREKIRVSLGLEPILSSTLLTKISLTYPSFGLDHFKVLAKHPSICVLKITSWDDYEQDVVAYDINVVKGEFPQLQVLEMRKLKIRTWTMEMGAMPSLECLVIDSCYCLKHVPDEIWCIRTLQLVELSNISLDLKNMLEQLPENSRSKISVKW